MLSCKKPVPGQVKASAFTRSGTGRRKQEFFVCIIQPPSVKTLNINTLNNYFVFRRFSPTLNITLCTAVCKFF